MVAETRRDRPALDFDVVIVGGGPAGLSTAIRLKQVAPEASIALVEKGAEIGAHILSGAVLDPAGLDALLPDWRESDAPVRTEVTRDRTLLLGPAGSVRLPNALLPPSMRNQGCFVVSLGEVCRWLARRAEALGVEILAGFAGADLLFAEDGAIAGIATGARGIGRDGQQRSSFDPGVELRAAYTVLAEGARGYLTTQAITRFGLDAGASPQKYALGLKELWRVTPEQSRPGEVTHGLGWPLGGKAGGGSFVYHFGDGTVAVGLAVHLDYADPYLAPFDELQRLKTHPDMRALLAGGERIGYGARAISAGGWQALPRLAFPGGVLAGCAAGMVNVARSKGAHNAMLSGMLAAEHIGAALAAGRGRDRLDGYDEALRASAVGRELRRARNVKPAWSRLGLAGGLLLGGASLWAAEIGVPTGTLRHRRPDHASLKPATGKPAPSPPPDGALTFDRLSSLFVSGTRHEENQPSHLQVRDPARLGEERQRFGGPSQRYCPAAVFEWREEAGTPRFAVNAGNCLHCKTCEIKDPVQTIAWTPPEGGDGPHYAAM